MIPLAVRYFEKGVFLGFDRWDSYLFQSCELMLLFPILTANYLFILSGLIDFHRRVHMIRACSALINPFKSEIAIKYQIFPAVNLTCKKSLHSWFLIRLCVMDFGKKYMTRIFLYCSTFFAANLFFVIVLLLRFFEILDLKLSMYA